MTYDELCGAIREAVRIERQAKDVVHETAEMCCGRLRDARVPDRVLSALKRELQDWDMHTKRWRNK
jgi:hypothetical protein